MVLTQAAAQARPGEGACLDVPQCPAGVSGHPGGVLAWAQRGPRSLRARSGVAELLLLHRLRAGSPAGMSGQAARVIGLTAEVWCLGGSDGKP